MEWLDQLDVECLHGDILSVEAQAVACNVNIMMSLNYRLGQQVGARCGPELASDLDAIRNTLPDGQLGLGSAITTPAYHLGRTEQLILFAWWGEDNEFTPQFIYKCLSNIFREALKLRVESLALPLFGTGSHGMRLQDLATQIVGVLQDFDRLKNSQNFSLKALHLCSDKSRDIAYLDEYIMGQLWR
ncbi:MAG: macro domain-containing protein [Nitrococcus sp.]|nr:macro domain-containing protein [Nitrococcus sp.]